MANSIEIATATQLGTASMVTVQVLTSTNGTVTSDKYFVFNANDFSATYDNNQPNICVLHFGPNHSLSISNADYQSFTWAGTAKASAIALATAVIDDVHVYAL